MSNPGFFALQVGVYNALGGASGLAVSGLGNIKVYDEPEVNAPFPFITLGDDELNDWGARDIDGFQGTFSIQVWSQGERGRATVKKISDAVYAALHKNRFSITGFGNIVCRFLSHKSDTQDGINWHADNRFSIIYQSN